MSFPRYAKYKHSGVEWLGQVPEHWEVTRAGSLGAFTSSGIDKKLVEGEVPVQMFNYLDVYKSNDKVLRYSASLMETTAPASKVDEHSVAEGDILLTPSSETRDDIGHAARVAEMPCPVVYSYHVIRLRLQHRQTAPYVTYALNAAPVRAYFEAVCTGTTRMVLVRDDLKNAPVAIPSPPEQAAIATFLDRETAKIDALIAEQQRLIELLQEKRQAVISHAVTKGLNPEALMKDSGIEWLGEVPEHWDVMSLKRLADIQTGVAKGKDNSGKATILVPYLRVANVQDGYLDLSEVTTIDIPVEELDRYALRAGDVLMNEGGDFDKLGRGCIWAGQLDPCISQNHVFAVRPRRVSSEWLNAITGSGYAQFYFMSRSKQSTNLASISSTNLMELPVILPPNEEQSGILAFMAGQTSLFASLTATATQAVSLLQERRSALISAAVTGQIDVRGLAGSEAA